jgi:hypothetical protein
MKLIIYIEASVAAQIEKISAFYQRQQFSFKYMRGIPMKLTTWPQFQNCIWAA